MAWTIRLEHGDCLEVIPQLVAEGVVADSIVTDPPYGLEFMGREWDGADGFRRSLNAADVGRDNVFGRTSRTGPEYRTTGVGRKSKPGIGDRQTEWVSNAGWNGTRCASCGHLFHGGSPCRCETPEPVHADNRWNLFQTWNEAWAREAFKILKPGGYMLCFGGTRTHYRMWCAIEDAGFVIQDTICWLYGTGFNKEGYLSPKFEKKLCYKVERDGDTLWFYRSDGEPMRTEPPYRHPEANRLIGVGGALKPAFEPICVAYKQGGKRELQIDECRIGVEDTRREVDREKGYYSSEYQRETGYRPNRMIRQSEQRTNGSESGRWPANVCHDGSDEVMEAFAAFGEKTSNSTGTGNCVRGIGYCGGAVGNPIGSRLGDSGTAARFFYSAKAGADDRWGSKHPTMKPVELMKWLVSLVTPRGGTVLDPFAGSGTTGIAARNVGRNSILIERDDGYVADIKRRMAYRVLPKRERPVVVEAGPPRNRLF